MTHGRCADFKMSGDKETCPQGHPRELRRKGRRDCAVCHRESQMRRRRAKGIPARPPAMTKEQYRLRRRHWEAKRRAAKRAGFVENVRLDIVYRKSGGICGICLFPVQSTAF